MEENPTRLVTSVTVYTDHFLANLLALTKILGWPIKTAKPLAKASPGIRIDLHPGLYVYSELSTDKIKEQLSEYEIKVTLINQ